MTSWRHRLAVIAQRNRREIIEAKLTRRDLAKLGLLTAGGMLVLKNGLSARADQGEQLVSPPTRPFIVELPASIRTCH